MERVRLTSQMNAVERVLASSHGVRGEARRLASANADLSNLYRDLVTPQPRQVPKPLVFLRKEPNIYVHNREESWDLAGCVLLQGIKRPKCYPIVPRRRL